jgi:ferritin
MSAWFEGINLKGFANWMYIQWQEETAHAMKFFNYVNERGGSVVLKAIDKPKASWKSIIEVFAETLKPLKIQFCKSFTNSKNFFQLLN